jgi:hypothetical protein
MHGALYAPFAAAGCRVTAVDGREGNCRKMRLLNEARGWGRVDVVRADVRDFPIPPGREIVLCCGLLYHLRAIEAVSLLHRLGLARPGLLVLDSMFAASTNASVVAHDRRWHYRAVTEPGTTASSREAIADAALGNDAGHWLDAGEVIDYLGAVGFRPIFQHAVVWARLPAAPGKSDDPRFRKLLFCVGPMP